MQPSKLFTIGTLALGIAAQAQAATTVLTFDLATDPNAQPACAAGVSGPTAMLCTGDTQSIGNDYGSTAELAVTYSRPGSSNFIFRIQDGNGAAGGTGNSAISSITFTPTAGNEVSFTSFDFLRRNNGLDGQFILTDAGGNTVFDFTSTVLATRTNYAANTSYFSGPLTLSLQLFGSPSVFVDNIALDVRPILITPPPVGGVPEPASWAMLVAGFGLTGSALRRRNRRSVVA